MQLRRVLPLSLVALLASAGCVSVGPRVPDVPARGAVPPVDAPESPESPASPDGSGRPGGTRPAAAGVPDPHGLPGEPLPLGTLPGAPGAGQDQDRDHGGDRDPGRHAAKAPRPATDRHAKPAAPRRARPPQSAPARPGRLPAQPPRLDELCAAAEGTMPPSVVDLCIRQSGGR
ncbi:hypothetical protein J7F03_21130 [Streptomyces sp. ISL-43]|uniref:hypothetical protein n=1 Tax=Streptomyces sp. ISL-43 TaxID=2819183 RepID=UPI001BE4EF68|nr:hypothetical protein [Streptomyces sp. ISL-43]MBT2449544.1 hypothetical protein [Streptomyces sp. ISL-43]